MHRRTLVSGLGIALTVALSGCLGGGPPTAGGGDGNRNGNGSGDGDDGPPGGSDDDSGGSAGGTHPRFTETSLTATGRCEDPGTAAVRFDDTGVTVTGCAHGRNGCAVPVLADVSYAVEENLLTVVVASEVEQRGDTGCTQALEPLGYEARVAMDGMVPPNVRVVHDDVDGRREVARVSRDGA
jgi:hypothetical protein